MGKNPKSIDSTVGNHVLQVIAVLERVKDNIHNMESSGQFEVLSELSHKGDLANANKGEALRDLSRAISLIKQLQEIIAER